MDFYKYAENKKEIALYMVGSYLLFLLIDAFYKCYYRISLDINDKLL